jgi:hypothetical protein
VSDGNSMEDSNKPADQELERGVANDLGQSTTVGDRHDQAVWKEGEKQKVSAAQAVVDELFLVVSVSDTAVNRSTGDQIKSKKIESATGVVGDIKPAAKPDSASKVRQDVDLAGNMQKIFARVDGGADGIITKSEINAAVRDSTFKGDDAKAVTGMKWAFDRLKNLDGNAEEQEGLSLSDLAKFRDIEQSHDSGQKLEPADQKLVQSVEAAHDATEISQRFGKDVLYGTNEDALDSIDPAAVEQGTTGDCYFMAAVASLAATNPRAIADIIKDSGVNEEGKHIYTVNFPGAGEPVVIEAPTQAELTLYAHSNKYGTWPAVLEKAYGEFSRQQQWFPDKDIPAAEVVRQGGGADNAMALLTGKDYTRHSMMFSTSEDLDRQLTQSFTPAQDAEEPVERLPVTVALIGDEKNDFGLKGPHEYAVVGYDSQTKQAVLRDPRGDSFGPRYEDGSPISWMQGSQPGTFVMTLEEVKRTFGRIHVARARDA